MTRTHLKHWRFYMDGVDLSGYARQIGALDWKFGAEPDAALTDAVKNILIGQSELAMGPLNAFLDNDTAGLLASFGTATNGKGTRTVTAVMGANAAPVAGSLVYSWQFEQTAYTVEPGTGFVAATVPFGGASSQSTLTYKRPWGVLLRPKETRLSSAGIYADAGIDDYGASPPELGGIFIYHLFTSNGTLTLSAQDAAVNNDGGFADSGIAAATSGEIDATTAPKHDMVALATNAAVRRYLRGQIAWGTATTATYATAFIRNTLA